MPTTPLSPLRPQVNRYRATSSLDGIWELRFQNDKTDASGWENGFPADRLVAVPASFNDLFTTYEERNHWGPVWYQRELAVPGCWEGQRVTIRFEAAAYQATVWLDGVLLGEHETGHSPFEFDITELVRHGIKHRLVACLNTRLTPDTVPPGEMRFPGAPLLMAGNRPPGNFDFFPYGGLQRSVLLTAIPNQHIRQVLVDTKIHARDATVSFRIQADGGTRARVTIEKSGETAEAAISGGRTHVDLLLQDVRLWDIGRGELYSANIELLDESGQVLDAYEQSFGCREVSIKGEHLFLNGRRIYLTGFGRHEDFPIIGRGHNDAVMVRDFELMKWMGVNSFRTSHYPYAEQQMDMADRLGLLVIAESPAVGIVPDLATERSLATHIAVQQESMLRDYNHPSVIAWSLANEPHSQEESAPAYFSKVVAAAREVDVTRPIMFVTCFPLQDRCTDLFDMVGINSYAGWYGGGDYMENTLDYLSGFLDQVHERIPGKPILVTEFGADAVAGFHGLPEEMWTEEYQATLIAETIGVFRTKAWLNGEHVWTFSDFRTGQNDRRAYGNRKGVFTRERLPKMAAHKLREIWGAIAKITR